MLGEDECKVHISGYPCCLAFICFPLMSKCANTLGIACRHGEGLSSEDFNCCKCFMGTIFFKKVECMYQGGLVTGRD